MLFLESVMGEARTFAQRHNDEGEVEYYQSVSASWDYNTNLTQPNQENYVRLCM